MRLYLAILLTLAGMLGLHAQAPGSLGGAAPPPGPASRQWSADELDTLLGPIALYPDPLISQILPASTFPSDVVLAARFIKSGQNQDAIEQQTWDASVKAVAHYPDVLKMMDEQLEWTTRLGQAVADDQAAVLQSVQRLRAKAQDKGNLVTTPQQVVIVTNAVVEKVVETQVVYVTNTIVQIQPAQPEVIYIPQYNPQVVYVERPRDPLAGFITFSAGFALGVWIHHQCDWYGGGFYYHHHGWNGGWGGGGGWGYHQVNNNINININNNRNNNVNVSTWKPANRPGQPNRGSGSGDRGWNTPRPSPLASAPGMGTAPGNSMTRDSRPNLGNVPAARPSPGLANVPGSRPVPNGGAPGGAGLGQGNLPSRPQGGAAAAGGIRPFPAPSGSRPAGGAFTGLGGAVGVREASQRGNASRRAVERPARAGRARK